MIIQLSVGFFSVMPVHALQIRQLLTSILRNTVLSK